jgi:hypothetical protein
MAALTWGKFKTLVDGQLEKAGETDDIEIWYIDISFPCDDHESCIPEIGVDDDLGLGI